MEIEIELTQIVLDGTILRMPLDHAQIKQLLPAPRREIPVPIRLPSGSQAIRRLVVIDEVGIYYLLDESPSAVPELGFVLFPTDAPHSMMHPYSGKLNVGGVQLTSDTTPARLKVSSVLFESSIGHAFVHRAKDFALFLTFKRRSVRGRRSGTPRLVYVSVCPTSPDHPFVDR
jgi:hypothetical protein